MGLGIFNLSARAQALPRPTSYSQFLANNLWLLVAAVLVIFMNAGFAMVEAGMCRQKNAVNILAKNLVVFALAVTAYWFIGYQLMYRPIWVSHGVALKFGGLFFDPSVSSGRCQRGGPCSQQSTSCSRQPSQAPPPRSSPAWWLSASSSASS